MINYIKYFTVCLSFISVISYSQSDAKIKFNEGIEAYNEGDYENAQKLFEKAYELDKDYSKAIYNAGNSAYLNGEIENAESYYNRYIEDQQDNKLKAEAYHNLGNLFYKKFLADKKKSENNPDPQQNKDQESNIDNLKKSIDYYKNALRANPNDDETRYNLSSALKHIPPPPPPSEDNQKKKEDQNQDKDKEEKKDQQQNQDQNQEDKKEENKQEEEEEKEGEISKDQMEKILKDINNEEKKLMEQMMKDSLKTKKGGAKNYKDW